MATFKLELEGLLGGKKIGCENCFVSSSFGCCLLCCDFFFFFESAADELLRRKRGWGMGQVCSVDKRTNTFVYSSIFRNFTLVSLPFFFFF